MKIQSKHIIAWLGSCAAHFTEQQDFLTALDRDIGDADHGLNMNRGFSAVKATLPDIERQHIDNILKNTGMKLLSSVGGASGPLYGTLFIRTSAAIGARTELSLEEGIAGVIARGKAEQGDKTLCDVWVPVLNEAKKNLQAGMSPSLLLNTMVQDAATAVDNTINMQAKKGRASYLGARSVGHQDPGATSSWLMIKAMQEGFAE
ncbi:dihydroxyacetone kinase subunit DhaL [Escherichia albertii]|uniref:dihydroxyacetone kinase subunit DhaL n=1 Tax=Escherichia albertii TaxID=208962 RepID=UPI0002BA3A1F|nr:dihydroxyacetone kinase subunit DhaL [Escherichia albertii]EFX6076911.1 dihydroxyacetone kinase subunit L [Shigella boydii]MCZ8626893.1 dihydroxyacetone kinase subunit DhaL [Escherichia albertii]MCZ8767773.1 dihydroxyacetone kinase subunit DhaL [Escherichia albertii]MCZ8871596.1 dihydroxyacetone kinase subunit DhaL [Escherichia albertii]MCZ8894022.1 dihydroxyacetone kinase subunit DhaL [Escherichia albertii]